MAQYYIVNPIEPIAVRYTGKTVWSSLPYRVRRGDRVVVKRLRIKLAHGAILQVLPRDLSLSSVPAVTRGKQYTWSIPRRMLEVVEWPPEVQERIRRTRTGRVAAASRPLARRRPRRPLVRGRRPR
jgi:hypothetical protein